MSKVLVTGGSGFVGAHIVQFLAAGHQVHTTVRNLNRESAVRDMVKAGGADPESTLSFVPADLTAYVKSKAIAERAAWDFIAQEGRGLELSAVNPTGLFGPILGPVYAPSIDLIKRLMNGMPGCRRLYFGVVDVRDVADLHLRAMTNPAAKGVRFIAAEGNAISMLDIAKMLRACLGEAAKRVLRRQLPDWLVRLAAKRDKSLQQLLPLPGNIRNATSEKARRMLGWSPRSNEETVVATAESLMRFGLLEN